jgi:hypothetical protein
MPGYSKTSARRRYSGGRTGSGGGIGFLPVLLLVIFAVVAWKFHVTALPSVSQVRGFLGL